MSAMQGELIDIIRRDRSRRIRRRKFGEHLTIFIAAWLINLLAGFWFMLAVGVIHHEWIRSCPTIGYWWAVVVISLLRGAFARTYSGKDDDR